jgi:hypothetical protein
MTTAQPTAFVRVAAALIATVIVAVASVPLFELAARIVA